MTSLQCKSLVLCCSDFRLIEATKNWLESKHLNGDYDLIALCGSVCSLVSNPVALKENFIFKQIELSILDHGVTELILLNHTDCSAYGGREAFDSAEIEHEQHLSDLKKAKELILNIFPELKVKINLAKINPLGNINIEEIE